MPSLISKLQTAVAGIATQDLSDDLIRDQVLDVLNDPHSEMTTLDAAEFLKRSVGTLKRWRVEEKGPRYRRDPQGRISYRRDWLAEFLSQGVVENTDDGIPA